ncbi:sigma-70 family RNA polymerase sigma factor [Bacillus sp. Y1]|nr:sigma-70 family RNA polymerase sigma factor [Bacillus sp. Y1]AYA77382.1 sigma-70 family RNA polymerase sigma factor [Bacillus sp. Y1]
MNQQQKLNINHAVTQYIGAKSESDFTNIYRDLLSEYQPKLSYWSSSTFMANDHDMMDLFHDTLLKSLDVVERDGGDFVKLFNRSLNNRYKSLLRKLKTRRAYEQYEIEREGEEEAATLELADDYRFEDFIGAKQKDDQRQLIDFLVRGENERTTAIVQSYLATDLKTPTAIGNYLGLDHKQVSRTFKRLAGKFDSKQFGDYHDYLVAL